MFFTDLGAWNGSQVGHVGIFFRHLGSQLKVLGPTWIQVGSLEAILDPSLEILKQFWLQVGYKFTISKLKTEARESEDFQAEARR